MHSGFNSKLFRNILCSRTNIIKQYLKNNKYLIYALLYFKVVIRKNRCHYIQLTCTARIIVRVNSYLCIQKKKKKPNRNKQLYSFENDLHKKKKKSIKKPHIIIIFFFQLLFAYTLRDRSNTDDYLWMSFFSR